MGVGGGVGEAVCRARAALEAVRGDPVAEGGHGVVVARDVEGRGVAVARDVEGRGAAAARDVEGREAAREAEGGGGGGGGLEVEGCASSFVVLVLHHALILICSMDL